MAAESPAGCSDGWPRSSRSRRSRSPRARRVGADALSRRRGDRPAPGHDDRRRRACPARSTLPTASRRGAGSAALQACRAGQRAPTGRSSAQLRTTPARPARPSRRRDGNSTTVRQLVAAHPQARTRPSPPRARVRLAGRDADAVASWRQAARPEPDSPSAVTAADLLQPERCSRACRRSSSDAAGGTRLRAA